MSIADGLRGQRSVAAHGHLSIDREKAREKLRLFRLPDPHYYVLQFVRAAAAMGATKINFQISTTEMHCSFDAILPPRVLEDIWASSFEQRTDDASRAAHYMALGFGSAQALRPAYIQVWSGNVIVRIDELEETAELGVAISETRVTVKEKLRLGHVIEFFATLGGQPAEVMALFEKCSNAMISVTVNGIELSALERLGSFQEEFEGARDRGRLSLHALGEPGSCAIVRDGVRLTIRPVMHQGQTCFGAMETSRIQTDLSGMGVAKEVGVDRAMHEHFYPAYHRALLKWVTTSRTRDSSVIGAIIGVLTYIADLDRQGGERSEATLELLQELTTRPLFEGAVRAKTTLSLRDAMSGGSVRLSDRTFHSANLSVAPTIWLSKTGVRAEQNRRLALALRGCSLLGARDCTEDLEMRAEAIRREAIWRAQPAARLASFPFQVKVRHADRVARAQLPLWSISESASESICRYSVFVSSRLLFSQAQRSLRLGVLFDGGSQVNESFSDIVHDDAHIELAIRLCVAIPDAYRAFAQRLIDEGQNEVTRPRLLDEFVHTVRTGAYPGKVFTAIQLRGGFETAMADPRVEQLKAVATMDTQAFIDWLGPIAHAPAYRTLTEKLYTLAEVLTLPDIMLLSGNSDGQAAADELRQVPPDELPTIVRPDRTQRAIIESLRPEVPDAADYAQRIIDRQRFLARPVYEALTDDADVRVIFRDGFDLRIKPSDTGSGSTCTLKVISEGRLLESTYVVVPTGRFFATASSPRLKVLPDYSGVRRDKAYKELGALIREVVAETLGTDLDELEAEVALQRFMARSPVAPRLAGGAVKWRGSRYDLDCEVALFADPTRGTGLQVNHVQVVYRGRLLEELDVPLPFGQCRSVVSGIGFQPDADYKAIAAGRAEIADVALWAASEVFRHACQLCIDRGGPHAAGLASIHFDMLSALHRVLTDPPRPPFALAATLRATPLFETKSGRWYSFDELIAMMRSDAPDQLSVPKPLERIVQDVFATVAHVEVVDESPAEPFEFLDHVRATLLGARGDDRHLLDDRLAASLDWATAPQVELCVVGDDGVRVASAHPLVARTRAREDRVSRAFLASAVYSRINAYYREITDHNELELQARLLRSMRD